jgi:hypothetical protein
LIWCQHVQQVDVAVGGRFVPNGGPERSEFDCRIGGRCRRGAAAASWTAGCSVPERSDGLCSLAPSGR